MDKLDTVNADIIIGYGYANEKHDVVPVPEERCIIHKKDAPLSVYAEDFINLCREVVDSGIILTK